MVSSATNPITIERVIADVAAFRAVDISGCSSSAVSDLLGRLAGFRSWASAAESALVNRADVLSTPPPSSPTPPAGSANDPDAPVNEPDRPEPEPTPAPEPPGPSPQDRLTNEANQSAQQARRTRRRAEVLKALPSLADVLAADRITEEHIDAVADLIERMVGDEPIAFLELATALDLPEIAARERVEEFARTLRGLLSGLRRETPDQRLARQKIQSFLNLFTNRDGMLVINGELDPETGAIVQSILNHATNSLWNAGNDGPLLDVPDDIINKAGWMRAQALLLLLNGSIPRTRADANPSAGTTGAKGTGRQPAPQPPASQPSGVSLVVYADALKLADKVSAATGQACGHLADGTPLGASTLRRLACDAQVMPLILGAADAPLNVGKAARTATRAQRRALQKLYPTCAFCSAPFDWCQMHHLWHWLDNGPTDLWNLLPVCNQHHHHIHDLGHTVRRNDDGTLTLIAADGTNIRTTTVAHPARPATGNLGGNGTAASSSPAGSSTSNSPDPSETGWGIPAKKKDKTGRSRGPTPPKRPESMPLPSDAAALDPSSPARGPDPALF